MLSTSRANQALRVSEIWFEIRYNFVICHTNRGHCPCPLDAAFLAIRRNRTQALREADA